MSLLICQLVVAAGRNPDWITEVRATDGFCEIRRGDADIASGNANRELRWPHRASDVRNEPCLTVTR